MIWLPCETSYLALLGEISKALQAYTGYHGNSQFTADDATAFDFGMQIGHRTIDKNGVRQANELNTAERKNMIDNVWFEKRDEFTIDEKKHDPKFHKGLLSLLRRTEKIKLNCSDATVFLVATQAVDSQPDKVSPTLVLLVVLARKTAQENQAKPQLSYQSWYEAMQEPLSQVAERHQIPFPILLFNISLFWVPSIAQSESSLDEQQMKLYWEAMERAIISEVPAYLMAAGLSTFYKNSVHMIQTLVHHKASSCLFNFLVFARNQRGWIHAIINTLDPAGALEH